MKQEKDSRVKKIALGTAQFGSDYGIDNPRGKIPCDEVHDILFFALANGIQTLDTAEGYGESESVIGQFVQKCKVCDLNIVSKFNTKDGTFWQNAFENSLKLLNVNYLYGYLIHDFNDFVKDPSLWDYLYSLKEKGAVKKIGFSLYSPFQLEHLLALNLKIDLLQVPYSILDQRFAGYFETLKQQGTEIHVRSIFLQGLLFKPLEKLQGKFAKIKDIIKSLQTISKESNLPISSLCINFAALNPHIDKIVIGINDLNQLKENIAALTLHKFSFRLYDALSKLYIDDEQIIVPSNW